MHVFALEIYAGPLAFEIKLYLVLAGLKLTTPSLFLAPALVGPLAGR